MNLLAVLKNAIFSSQFSFELTIIMFPKLNFWHSFLHCSNNAIVGTIIIALYVRVSTYSFNKQFKDVMVLPVPVAIAKIPFFELSCHFL